MAYLRCTQCGAKALSVASQCPRCAHLFDVYDARGMRVKLAFCRGCRFMHRGDAACPTCGVQPQRARWSTASLRRVAAFVGMCAIAGAGWRFGVPVRDAGARLFAITPIEASTSTRIPAILAPPVPAADSVQAVGADIVPEIVEAALSVATAAPSSPITTDSVRWVPAVALTWVNVRSDASRGGSVVGVIKPSARAMLGEDRAGWRLVKSPEVSGWVDPRLFAADSLRIRGD